MTIRLLLCRYLYHRLWLKADGSTYCYTCGKSVS